MSGTTSMGFTDYIQYTFLLAPVEGIPAEELQEIVISELSDLPFESFETEEGKVIAYVPATVAIEENIGNGELTGVISFEKKLMKGENWNQLWEQSFEPIRIGKDVLVRATFHQPDPAYTYEIIIEPKMSFGTGHHATTRLMMEQMLKLDFSQKKVIDMGCGTGILAILAEKLGAVKTDAIDHDEQCIINTRENIGLNHTLHIDTYTNEKIDTGLKADIVLANIQRNVLLEQMGMYGSWLKDGGYLLVSGIYEHMKDDIIKEAGKHGFTEVENHVLNDWCMIEFKK